MRKFAQHIDRKQMIRQTTHLTRPPRLEGKTKNATQDSVKKPKKSKKLKEYPAINVETPSGGPVH